jgi:Holliday junction resolvase
MKASSHQLVDSHARTCSVWQTAAEFGMCGQSVHERLAKMGVIQPVNAFTETEKERLQLEYHLYAFAERLDALAADMGRTKYFLCRQARALGLTDQKRAKPYIAKWKYMDDAVASGIWERFKTAHLTLGEFCRKHGFDDLGFSKTMRERFADEYDYVIELKAPKQTHYRLGRAVEYKVRDFLRKSGYFALRSPKSLGPLDVLAIKRGLVLFVQCKRAMAVSVRQWNALYDLSEYVGAIALVAGQPARRGLSFMRIIGPKDGTKRAQPWEPYEPDVAISEMTPARASRSP